MSLPHAGIGTPIFKIICRMSDAGDEIKVEAEVEVEAEVSEAPKGKLSVEDALQVRIYSHSNVGSF